MALAGPEHGDSYTRMNLSDIFPIHTYLGMALAGPEHGDSF